MLNADEMTHPPETQEQGDDEGEGTSQVQDEQMEKEGDSDILYGFGDSEPEAESTSSSSSSASEFAVPFKFNSVEIPQQDHEEDEEQDQKEDICFTTEFFDPNTDDLSKLGFKPKGIKCLSWHAGTWYCLVEFDLLSSLIPYEYLEKHMPDILVKFILENLKLNSVDGNPINANQIASISKNSTHDSDIVVDAGI